MRKDRELLELVRDEWLKVSTTLNMFSNKDMFFYKHRGFEMFYGFIGFLHADEAL